jgi:DNA (cytosine-5)-methyltransferase 1
VSAYYNEHDRFAAAWLRELITEGLIADGEVDERNIQDVDAADVRGFTQCHWFAGIGGWSYALRLAGWADNRPVWTGSCPCQPFSAAGQRKGGRDDRHLWPHWARLIEECRPATIVGEQVAAAIGHGWLDAVFDDLEGWDYACGAAVLSAASVGAPHRRDRLWFVADAESGDGRLPIQQWGSRQASAESERAGEVECMADAEHTERWPQHVHREDGRDRSRGGRQEAYGEPGTRGEVYNPWADVLWLPCRDGKYRPTQPGLQPLAHGVPARVGRLRGYGNAIVPQVAAAFIDAYCAARDGSYA